LAFDRSDITIEASLHETLVSAMTGGLITRLCVSAARILTPGAHLMRAGFASRPRALLRMSDLAEAAG